MHAQHTHTHTHTRSPGELSVLYSGKWKVHSFCIMIESWE